MSDSDINRACALHWVDKQPLRDIYHVQNSAIGIGARNRPITTHHVQNSAIGIGARNRPITTPHFSRHFCTRSISRYFLVSSLTVHVGP